MYADEIYLAVVRRGKARKQAVFLIFAVESCAEYTCVQSVKLNIFKACAENFHVFAQIFTKTRINSARDRVVVAG